MADPSRRGYSKYILNGILWKREEKKTSNNFSEVFFHTAPILKTIHIKESLNTFQYFEKNIMTKYKKSGFQTSKKQSLSLRKVNFTRKFLLLKC